MIKNRTLATCIVATVCSAVFARPVAAQDANALVAQMEAAYRNLKSYAQIMKATGKITIDGKTRTGEMTSELRYRAPDRLYVAVLSPTAGPVVATTDGKEQIIYFGKRKAYIKQTSPGSVREFVSGLKRHRIVALLDPLYFVAGESAAALVEKFEARGQETVNGVTCDKIIGTLKPNAVQQARSGRVVFWIDRKTSLLRKTVVELNGVPFRPSTPNDPQSSPLAAVNLADQSVTETISKLQVNPTLKDPQLSARLPVGSKQIAPGASR